MSTMHGCYESGSHCHQVCFPLNEIHSFSLDLQCSTISFGSSAFSIRCMFLGLILALVLLVVSAPQCHRPVPPPCLLSFPLPCYMLFLEVVLQPKELSWDIAVAVGSSSQSQIGRNVRRTDASFLRSLTSLSSLCSF